MAVLGCTASTEAYNNNNNNNSDLAWDNSTYVHIKFYYIYRLWIFITLWLNIAYFWY